MRLILTTLTLLALAATSAAAPDRPHTRLALEAQKYWVYCIDDKVSVEMWDLAQMKVRRGSDVCQLHESTSMSGAMSWMEKNFPTKTCSCAE